MKCFIILLVLFFTLLVSLGKVLAQNALAPTPSHVEAVGLEIHQTLSEADQNLEWGDRPENLVLDYLVTNPTRHIIGIVKNASKVKSWQDDKGTDLAAPVADRDGSLSSWDWIEGEQYSQDQHKIGFSVRTWTLPVKDATAINFQAALKLRYGSAPTTVILHNVPLRPGTPLTLGKMHLRIATFVEGHDKGTWELQLISMQHFDSMISLTIQGHDGKRVNLTDSRPGEGMNSIRGVEFYNSIYELEKHVTRATLKFVYYSKVETDLVPINTTIGIGL